MCTLELRFLLLLTFFNPDNEAFRRFWIKGRERPLSMLMVQFNQSSLFQIKKNVALMHFINILIGCLEFIRVVF